jgi:hypothetical protein
MPGKDLITLMSDIKNSLEHLVTLEIITAVGAIKVNDDKGPDLDYDKAPKMILTKINLLQGDIKTVFDEEFVTGPYQALREFHGAREKEGYQLVQNNIAALERLFQFVKSLARE